VEIIVTHFSEARIDITSDVDFVELVWTDDIEWYFWNQKWVGINIVSWSLSLHLLEELLERWLGAESLILVTWGLKFLHVVN